MTAQHSHIIVNWWEMYFIRLSFYTVCCGETFYYVLDALQGSEWRTIPSGVCMEGN
jgi:hypothetical protein